MMAATLYGVLGVAPTASPEDVRAAYRRRALEVCAGQAAPVRLERATDVPSSSGGAPPPPRPAAPPATGGDGFAALQAAYETLADPARRAQYDAEQAGTPAPPEPHVPARD
jgi:curved DNA-binding protein CbpA